MFDPGGAWLGLRLPQGGAALRLQHNGELVAEAWGPGAEAAVALAPSIAGLLDDPSLLIPHHPLVRELERRFAGLRLPATRQLVPALVAAVTEQKVTSTEAHAAYSRLLRRLGEPAPGSAPGTSAGTSPGLATGPAQSGLLVPPDPLELAALPVYEYHAIGLERRRAEIVRAIGRVAVRIEEMTALSPLDARARLQLLPGIGAWTAAEATRAAFGDPDAVSIGDAHIPSMVTWALAREPRGDDARMLELLEPYPGQRARVIRLLEAAGIRPPRRGPRFSPRDITRI